MPFALFKWVCNQSSNIEIHKVPYGISILNSFKFADQRYQNWLVEKLDSGDFTRLEYMCITQHRLDEMLLEEQYFNTRSISTKERKFSGSPDKDV